MPTQRKAWTRDELLVTLNLYHKLPFGQLHSRNPAIIALAEKLGRVRDTIEHRQFTDLATNLVFSTRDFRAVPAKYRALIPEYVKDYVSLNQFAA